MHISRRSFLLNTSAIALVAATPAAGGINNPGSGGSLSGRGALQVNLGGVGSGNGFSQFLNWMHNISPSGYNIQRSAGGNLTGSAAVFAAGGIVDANFNLVNPVAANVTRVDFLFFTAPNQLTQGAFSLKGTKWNVTWTGSPATPYVVDVAGLTGPGGAFSRTTSNSGTFTFGASAEPGDTYLRFTLTPGDIPPSNIVLSQDRYSTNVANGEMFNPDWLADIRNFGVLRFMDWMGTNNTSPNAITLTDYSQIATESFFTWGTTLGSSATWGTSAGGMPLSVICRLGNLTGCKLHVCIPIAATDACVTSIATFMKANTNCKVIYELSNEVWNGQFLQSAYSVTQGVAIWGSGDAARGQKWYGYRSSAIMKIVRDIYADTARWEGALGTQMANAGVTDNVLIGVNYWRANVLLPANSLNVNDLFGGLYMGSYWGDVVTCSSITGITNAATPTVTSAAHGFSNGQVIKMFMAAGMTALDNTYQTVAGATTNTYTIATDTSGMPAYASGNNYALPATLFQMMDQSATNNGSNPALYPTVYTYFNQQLAQSHLTGTCTFGFNTTISVASLVSTYWPAQKTRSVANGLALRDYEGGSQYVGAGQLNNASENSQFNLYQYNYGNSAEIGPVYAASYAAAFTAGITYPSKFVEIAVSGRFGIFAGMRFIPGDEGNPVWAAVRGAN